MYSIKSEVRVLMHGFKNRFPAIIPPLIRLAFPIPRLAIALAQGFGMPGILQERRWHLRSGPLRGYRLQGLLPEEAMPILCNEMEPQTSQLIEGLDLEGSTVIDVGASYGYYALLFARLVKHGTVLALEPDWRSFARLAANIQINSITNIIPISLCASNGESRLTAWESKVDAPWESCQKTGESRSLEQSSIVSTTSIDSLVNAINVQTEITAVKIDVEGAEVAVLEGALRLLQKHQPILFCEIHTKEAGKRIKEILYENNYVVEEIEYVSDQRSEIVAWSRVGSRNRRYISERISKMKSLPNKLNDLQMLRK